MKQSPDMPALMAREVDALLDSVDEATAPHENVTAEPAAQNELDPLLKGKNIEVEAEELLEAEHEKEETASGNRLSRLRIRLGKYGNRVLEAGRRFVTAFSETIAHIGSALAGSILLLPLVIVTRGISVLGDNIFKFFKPAVLSFFRLILEVMRAIIWPLHQVLEYFNKEMLYPLIKRIKEDDTAALLAFGVLVALAIGVFFLLNWIF